MNSCAACGAKAPVGTEACPTCGAPLEAVSMQFGIVCPNCDTYNGPGQEQCKSCTAPLTPSGFTGFFSAANLVRSAAGGPLAAQVPGPEQAPSPGAPAPAPTPAVTTAPATGIPAAPPAAAPEQSLPPAAPAPAAADPALCSVCKTPNSGGSRFCGGCGTPLSGGGGTMMLPSFGAPQAAEAAQAPASSGTQFFGAMAPGRAKLILIRGEGFEGAEFRLNAQEIKAGRSVGLILFPNDATLAPHHATFLYREGRLHVRDEGSPSGSYVRLRGEQEISPGSDLVVGEHRLRYLGALPEASGKRAGAARPDQAVRFEERLRGDRPGRAYLLQPGSALVGRGGAHIELSTDRFVSTRHCELRIQGGRVWINDLGSVNGTFVRLPGGSERGLAHGDYLMLGKQVLRVEVASDA